MAIQIQGNGGTVAEVGGTLYRAVRTEDRPIDYGSLGSYALSSISGTMAAGLAANSEIYQFRWTDATRVCAVTSITIEGLAGSATAFTAGFGKVDVLVARAFSAAGSGGTAATITVNNQKLRTSMGTTLLGESRCASTAALGAGTKTLDANPIGIATFTLGTVVSATYLTKYPLFDASSGRESPLLLATNEGFAIRATVPATGTWQFGVTVKWTELTGY
jgi:hypothetical protein